VHEKLSRRRLAAAVTVPALALAAALTPAQLASAGPEDRGHGRTSAASPGTAGPIVIGHRGASGYRPEHTLEAYRVAIAFGADYIEPDVVSTKDGVLVARHENEISETTDVASRAEFADRRTTKVIDGREMTGWFTEDFTLEELKTLRAIERLPELRQENTLYDGRSEVPTLREVLDLARWEGRRAGRTVGVYIETKHPSYFDGIGLSLEEPLVADLHAAGLDRRTAPVFVQSFETGSLRDLATMTQVPLVQLLGGRGGPADRPDTSYDELANEAGLREIAGYADGIGPDKNRVIPRTADGRLGEPTSLVADAHAAGLLVHPYTFRNENVFLPVDLRRGANPADYGDAFSEYQAFFEAGIDGLFSDNPDTAVAARDAFVAGRQAA
jgi:glycerophosphoryl diester phosphodiesterase